MHYNGCNHWLCLCFLVEVVLKHLFVRAWLESKLG